jgi:hypothetical protein
MGKKNIRIDIEYDYDFLLIGICSPLKEYQLCYHINKVFQIELQRSNEDIEMTYPEALEQGIYPLYEYWDTQYENQWYLHANTTALRCKDTKSALGTIFEDHQLDLIKTKRLIPEDKIVDYYLQIHGVFGLETTQNLLKAINTINRVVNAHEVPIDTLRSKENLII